MSRRTFYNYDMPDGTLLYQKVRYDDATPLPGVDERKKKFLVRRPVRAEQFDRERNIGECVFGSGPRRVIYNWPAVLRAGPGSDLIIAEGEKNADELIAAGLLATTTVSHDWPPECLAAVADMNLIILEDNDEHGRRIAAEAQAKTRGVARTTRVVPLDHLWRHLAPGNATKGPPQTGDVSDWLAYGGDPARLLDICRERPADGTVNARPHDFPAEQTIAMWDWLYGKHLLRGTVSGTAAMGGTGKSSLSIVEALAMTSAKALLNVSVGRPLRVMLINMEDDRSTMNKRIAAAMRHHELSPGDIDGRLFTVAKGEMKLKIARQSRAGTVEANEPLVRGLISFLTEREIDVLSVDPFIRTHGVPENDNPAVQQVVELYEDVADEAGCAVHLWHHTRKSNGQATTIDSLRGASSFIDSMRSVRILETMPKDDATKLNVKAGWYFRSFSGKLNFAPPIAESEWYRFENLSLDNGGPSFGDDVGTVTHWQHPESKGAELSVGTIVNIMAAVGSERRYREYVTADLWVGKVIGPILGLDPDDDRDVIKKAIKKLLDLGALKRSEGKNQKRESKMFVVAGDWVAPGLGPG